MPEIFSDILDAMNDPASRHAILVHFPVALAVLAPLLLIASMIAGGKNRALRLVAVGAYVLLAAAAWAAVLSGESANDHAGATPAVVGAMLHEHEEMAEKVWIFALAVAGLAAGGLHKKRAVSITSLWLALAGGAFTAGWVGVTAHKGGTMVYQYGTGTPAPLTQKDLDPDASPASADPRVDFFLKEVRPVLVDRCMGCHRDGREEDGLNMTTMANILDGSDDGKVLTPGNPESSPIYTAVAGLHPLVRMPKTGKRLTPEQIEAIRRWIEQGAVWAE